MKLTLCNGDAVLFNACFTISAPTSGGWETAGPDVPYEARAPSALGAGAAAPAADGVYDLGFTPSSAGKHKVKSGKVKPEKIKPEKIKPDKVKPEKVTADKADPDKVKPDQSDKTDQGCVIC